MTAYTDHLTRTAGVFVDSRHGTMNRLHFDSVSEAVAVCRDPATIKAAATPSAQRKRVKDQLASGESWTGLPAGFTFDKLLQLLDDGWEKGASRVQSLDVPVPPARNVRRRMQWRDQGDFVDMQRVWSGRIDTAWQSAHRQSVPTLTTKTLCVDIGANCNVDSDELFWRGAAVLCLSDVLTKAGFNVEILAVDTARGVYTNGDHFACTIVVKPATAPLELNTLASVVCCGGFFRGVIFELMQLSPDRPAETFLGRHADSKKHGSEPEGSVGGTGVIRNLATARQWVFDALRDMGVQLEGSQ